MKIKAVRAKSIPHYVCYCEDPYANYDTFDGVPDYNENWENVYVVSKEYLDGLETSNDQLLSILKDIKRSCPCDPDINDKWYSAWSRLEDVLKNNK